MARPLRLSSYSIPVERLGKAAEQAGETIGLPHLSKLPVELLHTVCDYSNESLLWRYISAINLAADASTVKDELVSSIQLTAIRSWERHGELRLDDPATLPLIMRITMDTDGIRRVERLETVPEYDGECHKHYAYIVVHEGFIRKITAQL